MRTPRRRPAVASWMVMAGMVLVTTIVVLVFFQRVRPADATSATTALPVATGSPKAATPTPTVKPEPVAVTKPEPKPEPTPAVKPTPTTTTTAAPAPGAGDVPVLTGVVATPPPGADPPRVPWATAHGKDAFGHWLTISVNGVQQRLRWIPPGTGVVGSPKNEPGRKPDNENQSTVTFTFGVWLADTECTQAFWQAVTGTNPSEKPHDPRHPVNKVSVADAILFARSLRTRLGNARVRIPSRAEWERACRAGTTTAYFTGDDPHSLQGFANLYDLDREAVAHRGKPVPISDGFIDVAPVASFKPNPWGLYDMHGNIAEYCLGVWNSLPPVCSDPDIDDDPAPQRGFMRGGDFDNNTAGNSRSASHGYVGEGVRNVDIGLRLLIEAPH